MSDALINGLAGAGGGIIAQLLTYPLQTVNTRQQTERDLKREKRKLGTIEHMCQVFFFVFHSQSHDQRFNT
jgi:adenine nucleotide transporter 17